MSDFNPITENVQFDTDFWHKYSVCPYPNSEEHPYQPLGFTEHLRIFDELLTGSCIEGDINCKIPIPDQIWIGAGCDPYCHMEKRERITRRVLEVSAKHKCSVFVATRNTLALRDIDLIQEIHENSYATVAITCSSLHIKTLRDIEPRATSLKNRKLIVKRFQRAGIRTGLMITPFIRGLSNSNAELEKIFRWSAENNLDFVLFPNLSVDLRMKAKNNADLIQIKRKAHPTGILSPLEYPGDASADRTIFELSQKYDISLRIGRFCPSDFRKENYRFAADLANLAFYRRLCNLPFRALLKVARSVNSLNSDIQNLIRLNSLFTQPWMDKSVLPEAMAILSGESVRSMIKSFSTLSVSVEKHE